MIAALVDALSPVAGLPLSAAQAVIRLLVGVVALLLGCVVACAIVLGVGARREP